MRLWSARELIAASQQGARLRVNQSGSRSATRGGSTWLPSGPARGS